MSSKLPPAKSIHVLTTAKTHSCNGQNISSEVGAQNSLDKFEAEEPANQSPQAKCYAPHFAALRQANNLGGFWCEPTTY